MSNKFGQTGFIVCLDECPKIVTHTNKNHSLSRLGDAEIHGVHQPGGYMVSGSFQLPHDLGKDQLHLAHDHAADVLHHEDPRLESLEQSDVFPKKLIPTIIHFPLTRSRESLARRGAVQDVQFAWLKFRHSQTSLHGKLSDVAMPDRDIRKVQLERFDGMVVPPHSKEFPIACHAVPVHMPMARAKQQYASKMAVNELYDPNGSDRRIGRY